MSNWKFLTHFSEKSVLRSHKDFAAETQLYENLRKTKIEYLNKPEGKSYLLPFIRFVKECFFFIFSLFAEISVYIYRLTA